MDWMLLRNILIFIQHGISFIGILIILSGVLLAACQYVTAFLTGQLVRDNSKINAIRLSLGRVLILGLEFIIAADLISTTTTPDYYAVGMVVIIVIIRTFLSMSLNREIMSLSKE